MESSPGAIARDRVQYKRCKSRVDCCRPHLERARVTIAETKSTAYLQSHVETTSKSRTGDHESFEWIEMVVGDGLVLLRDRELRGMPLLRTIFILP